MGSAVKMGAQPLRLFLTQTALTIKWMPMGTGCDALGEYAAATQGRSHHRTQSCADTAKTDDRGLMDAAAKGICQERIVERMQPIVGKSFRLGNAKPSWRPQPRNIFQQMARRFGGLQEATGQDVCDGADCGELIGISCRIGEGAL